MPYCVTRVTLEIMLFLREDTEGDTGLVNSITFYVTRIFSCGQFDIYVSYTTDNAINYICNELTFILYSLFLLLLTAA